MMVHNWKWLYVDTDTKEVGKQVIMRFVDEDGDTHEFQLNPANVRWLRSALKKAKKLAKMSDG